MENKKKKMRRGQHCIRRVISILLVVVFVLQPQYVYADYFTGEADAQTVAQMQTSESDTTEHDLAGNGAAESGLTRTGISESESAGSGTTESESNVSVAESESTVSAAESESTETETIEGDSAKSESDESESSAMEAAGNETTAVEMNNVPSDGSLGGQELKFVNLYWETDDIGDIEAVFDGGSGVPYVQTMRRGDRGVYEVTIPSGDYSSVAFRIAGSENLLDGTAYNIYGMESAPEVKAVSFISDENNTYYYDMGENPSYWGQDPDYEPETSVQTYSINASWQPGDDYNVVVQPGDMVYMIDMEKVEGQRSVTERVNIAFLKKDHTRPDPIIGKDGEAYTMYERRNGFYSAPFPENVDLYEEIAFQLVGRDDVGNGGKLERHYNFRGNHDSADTQSGYFKYKPGYIDAFYLNLVEQGNTNEKKDASFWGAHSTRANDSLDTQVMYVDVTDYTGNGLVADIDDLWIRWAGMKEGMIEGAQYDAVKGYKISDRLTQENFVYFQFPYNSGATEQSILTLTFTTKKDGVSIPKEYTYKFTFVPRSGRNCLNLDNVWEFNGQMWTHFKANPGDKRTIFFYSNEMEKVPYDIVRARLKDNSGKIIEVVLSGVNGSDQLYNKKRLFSMNVPSQYTSIQFKGTKDNGKTYYYSKWEEISTKFGMPCYYAYQVGSASETPPESETDPTGIIGYWRSVYSTDTSGDESIDIPEDTFVREENVFYGTSTFYDYYSTWEMSGTKLTEVPKVDDPTYKKQGEMFNAAAEQYYKDAFKNYSSDIQNKFNAIYMTGDVGTSQNKWQGNKGANNWTEGDGGPVLGLADSQLQNGIITTGSSENFPGVEMPFFNEDFLRGNNALGTAVGNIYKNVQFPFTKDEADGSRTKGYWVYNSGDADDALRMSYNVDDGYFMKRTNQPIKYGNDSNGKFSFFPFSSYDASIMEGGHVTNNKQKMNYMFGAQFNIDFALTDNAEIYNEYTNKDEPIRFEFQGDDDAWIYVDGILAVDLGGIHDAVRGEINFKEGTYTIWQAIKSGATYEGKGRVFKTGNLPAELVEKLREPGASHTLTMFYLERGLYESNLKISFNFPRESTFAVEKTVDVTSQQTADAENIFAHLLQNMGGFNFEIQNLVTSEGALPVEESAGYMKPGAGQKIYDSENSNVVFSFENGAGSITGNHPKQIEQQSIVSGAEPDEAKLLKIQPEQTMNLTNMSYLRLEMKNKGASDSSARNLYLSFKDTKGNRVGGYANTIGYDGETNSFVTDEASIIRVDFRQMTGSSAFDWANVAQMMIGIRRTNPEDSVSYEISSIAFFEAKNEVQSGGFSVTDDKISDYGSYDAGTLVPVDDAWFIRKNKVDGGYDSGVSRQTDKGMFALADGQQAVFTDKFRTGSYIALKELNVDPKVFDTQWTIMEDGQEVDGKYLLNTRDDVSSVQNPLNMISDENAKPLSNVSGTEVTDGRIENIDPDWPNIGKINPPNENEKDQKAIVYRSYINPDISSNVSTNLSVDVKNTLKYGQLTIEKELYKSESVTVSPGDYTFDVYYVDIAGMGLESQLSPVNGNDRYVRQTVTVHVDFDADGNVRGSTTLYNIPAGTTYYIVERPTNGTKLIGIDLHPEKDTKHENVRIVNAGTVENEGASGDWSKAYVTGTAYDSDKIITFTNEREPFYMDIEKIWNDGLTDEDRGINEIYISLQRKFQDDSEAQWDNVTKDFFDDPIGEGENAYIVLTPEKNWKTTSKTVLPYKDENSGKLYEYRIQEIDKDGALKNYEVSYDEIRNPDKDGKLHVTYRATNTLVGINVVKVWDDNDNIGGIRPKRIRVKLVASIDKNAEGGWKCYKGLEDENHQCKEDECYIELTENMAWRKSVENLKLEDASGNPYYYKLADEQIYISNGNGAWEDVTESGQSASSGSPISGYEVTYGEPQQPQGINTVTISMTNKIDFGNITIEKFAKEDTNKRLEGAEFKLERLIEETDNTDKTTWKVDQTFKEKIATTSATGTIEFQKLPYGTYRITETKAPSGYVPMNKPIEVTINDAEFAKQAEQHQGDLTYDASKKLITVKIFNEKGLHIPTTGGRGIVMFTIVGLALCMAAALLYINKVKALRRTHHRRRK